MIQSGGFAIAGGQLGATLPDVSRGSERRRMGWMLRRLRLAQGQLRDRCRGKRSRGASLRGGLGRLVPGLGSGVYQHLMADVSRARDRGGAAAGRSPSSQGGWICGRIPLRFPCRADVIPGLRGTCLTSRLPRKGDVSSAFGGR